MASKTISQLTPASPLVGTEELPLVQAGSTLKTTAQDIANLAGGGLEGTNYVFVMADGTDTENAAKLQAAYNTAKTMSPSATNRITVICAPGKYNFGSATFTLDTQYINLVSLDGNSSVIFSSSNVNGVPRISASNIFIKGINVINRGFTLVSSTGSNLTFENCRAGGAFSFSGAGFANCLFKDCVAGSDSFNYYIDSTTSFVNCAGGDRCFGNESEFRGIATNCVAGSQSFGQGVGESWLFAGKIYYSRITAGAFPTASGANRVVYCLDASGNPVNSGFVVQNKI